MKAERAMRAAPVAAISSVVALPLQAANQPVGCEQQLIPGNVDGEYLYHCPDGSHERQVGGEYVPSDARGRPLEMPETGEAMQHTEGSTMEPAAEGFRKPRVQDRSGIGDRSIRAIARKLRLFRALGQ